MRSKVVVALMLLAGLLLAGLWLPFALPEGFAPASGRAAAATQPRGAAGISAGDTITVAIIVPVSGVLAGFGGPIRDGAILAIEQANAAGGLFGKSINPVVLDGGCNATTAANAANQAIDQYHAHYIIGEACSSASMAIAPIADARHVLQVATISSGPDITLDAQGHARPYVFRACPIDPLEGAAAARFTRNTLGKVHPFILFHDNSYYANFAQGFDAQFSVIGTVAGRGHYDSSTTDFTAFFTAATTAQADMIYLPEDPGKANGILGQARAMGLTLPFIGMNEWHYGIDPNLSLGSYFTDYYAAGDPRPAVPAFESAFAARFAPETPEAPGALGYDAARLMLAAISAAGRDDATATSLYLAGLKYEGPTGVFGGFDAHHNPNKSIPVLTSDSGGFSFVAAVPPIYPHSYLPLLQR